MTLRLSPTLACAMALACGAPASAADFGMPGVSAGHGPGTGVTSATFEGATNGMQPGDVLHFQHEQPEFTSRSGIIWPDWSTTSVSRTAAT